MPNQYMAAYSLNPRVYVDNLDASIEFMATRPDTYLDELGQFFHPVMADSTSWKMSTVGSVIDLPKENEDEDDLPASVPATGYDKTFSLVNYRQKVQITDTFARADRFGKAQQMAGGLPNSCRRLKEYLRAAIFANAFTSGTGSDGAYMIANSHAPENPRGTARDNLTTGALNYSNWHAMRLLADQQKDELGNAMPGDIKTLLVPSALRRVAVELQTTKLQPYTAMNTAKVLTDFNVVVGHYLTSSTAWFGFTDRSGVDKGMFYVHLVDEDIKDVKPSDNADIVWAQRVKTICTFGFSQAIDYCYGSAGS